MFLNYNFRNYNYRLFLYVLLLNILGVLLIRSATNQDMAVVGKQIMGIAVGLVLVIGLSLLDYHKVLSLAPFIYGICIAGLIAVLVAGVSRGGATRWLVLPGIGQIQPSEFAKIGLIVFFSWFFSKNQEKINRPTVLALGAALYLMVFLLIYEQPDMKNTLMLLAVFCILIYIAGLSYKIIGGMFLIIIPLAIIFVSIVVQPDQKLIKDYQRKRIMAFLYPENEEYSDDIEQQNNSKTAIASGELIGKKLSGDKEVASVNDGNFVSENQTDFIFAVAGEEYGFMGCCSIVILLLAISVECIRMSLRAKDLSGKIICCGMASIISLQSFLNICVATGIAPNTGTPLPFVSYGLTSLISLYIGMGMVLNVGLQSSAYNKEIRRKAIDQKEDYL